MSEWIKTQLENKDYRRWVGPRDLYDVTGEYVSGFCKKHGLKKTHNFCDIGCGSLRVGRHIIEHLNKGNYYGVEANYWLIEEASKKEDGLEEILEKKQPHFHIGFDFDLGSFDKKFDMILAHEIFIHASMEQVKHIIEQVKKTLKPDGVFIFNYMPGADNKKAQWSYPQAVRYRHATINHLMEDFYIKRSGFFKRHWIIGRK